MTPGKKPLFALDCSSVLLFWKRAKARKEVQSLSLKCHFRGGFVGTQVRLVRVIIQAMCSHSGV